ncbi:NAD(P)-dependent oxidoreductase [bacterium]|nr:NAD(P)-dependent oxidoreductase [bacterium]
MKFFITGSTGFIGSHLIDHLQNQKNIEIFAQVRNLSNLKWLRGKDIHFLKGDLFSIPSLPSDIDYVFHLAGLTKSTKMANYYTVNHRGTASFFRALRSQKISPRKIIYLSSLAAVGPSYGGHPVKETDSPHPITPYGESKFLGEKEVLRNKHDFPVVIIRPGPIFGPRDTDFLSYFKWINKGILPSFDSSPRWISICYVRDLINALILPTQFPTQSGEIFHIADPCPYSYDKIGKTAGDVLGKKLKRVKIPLSFAYPFVLISDVVNKLTQNPIIINRDKYIEMKQEGWMMNTQKSQKKLSFFPRYSLREGLEETLHWYQQNNWM